jgi:hypothetical protein
VDSFAHLHVHAEYSMLDGAAKIAARVAEAERLGMPAVAMTDHGDHLFEEPHPDMVIIPLSTFRRRLTVDGRTVEVEKVARDAGWVPAQTHVGENIGSTDTHALFVELK